MFGGFESQTKYSELSSENISADKPSSVNEPFLVHNQILLVLQTSR